MQGISEQDAAAGLLSLPRKHHDEVHAVALILKKLPTCVKEDDAFESMWPLARFLAENKGTKIPVHDQRSILQEIVNALKRFHSSPKFVTGAVTIIGLFTTKYMENSSETARYRMFIDVGGIPTLISSVKKVGTSDIASLAVAMLSSISYISPKDVATNECIDFVFSVVMKNPNIMQAAQSFFSKIITEEGVRASLKQKGYDLNRVSPSIRMQAS